ncbi:MAG: hypothetical protein DI610_04905 [Staphylococcus hominis]|nr:MAG: hypothetical protein DI610_04905 [Staphylococcus hominis]
MPRNIDWRHFIALGGVLVSVTLPYLLFPREEYEYVEVIDEPEDEPVDTEPEKETADDQQED